MIDDPDALTLTVNGVIYGGWQEVRVTRGIELMPSSFDLTLTELYPGQVDAVVVKPGQACVVRLGSDVVLTGFVNRVVPAISAEGHQVHVSGRGRCQDLTDCSAGFNPDGSHGFQVNAADALTLARTLAKPFGITVTEQGSETGYRIPNFMINFGETPYEIIDRIAQYQQVLAYEGPDGNLILSQVGTEEHASGFAQGANVETASVSFSDDQRFSDYYVLWTSTDIFSQEQAATGGSFGIQHGYQHDDTTPRFRPRAIVSQQTVGGIDLGQQVAAWEMNRRNGRGQVASITTDAWRDSAGRLWQPNMLARLELPTCKLPAVTWIIAEVTYRRGEDGTHADLVLMPPDAFKPQPVGLNSVDYQVWQALQRGSDVGPGHA